MASIRLLAHQVKMAGKSPAAIGLAAALARAKAERGITSSAAAPRPAASSRVIAIKDIAAKDLVATLSPKQLKGLAAAMGKQSGASVWAAPATQVAQTAEQARAEMREAIAASQGKTIAPAKATAPAPAPKPAIASIPAKTTSTKAGDVWGSAIARMGKPAALSASKASMAPWDKVIDRMKAAR